MTRIESDPLGAMPGRGQGPSAGGTGATMLFACTFILLATTLVPLAYLGAVMEGVIKPSGAPLASSPLTAAILSPVTQALLALLAALAAAGALLSSAHRLRRGLVALGAALLVTALLTALVALLWDSIAGIFDDAWNAALAGSGPFYRSWSLPCACALAAGGAICLSACASVALFEKGVRS